VYFRVPSPRRASLAHRGLYEVTVGANIAYVSADGRFLVSGDLYEIKSRNNLSEERRVVARRAALASLKDQDTIVFAPAEVKHTITVFTDRRLWVLSQAPQRDCRNQ